MRSLGQPHIPLICIGLIIITNLLINREVEAVQGCSVFFLPDFKWKKAICDSEASRLNRIPVDLPNNLVELHVTHQFIAVLNSEGVRDLVHLQILAIESSGLRRVMLDALHTLTNLTHLNLRNNSLQLGYDGLPAEVIRGLPRLKMLNLAENPVSVIPDLFFTIPGSGVPSPLNRLWLGSTKSAAMHVERYAFVGLRRLRLLDLSHAKLTTLPVSIAGQLDSMTELRELYLGGNPWHCDCQLRWLRFWFVRRHAQNGLTYEQQHANQYGRQVTSEPICFSPEQLRDRKLFGLNPVDTIDFSEVHCVPKLLTSHQNVTVMAGKISKLTCEFYADPKASVIWLKDGTIIKNDSQFSVVNQFVEETLVSNLYVHLLRVGESTSLSCTLDGYHGDILATYHVTVIPYDGALDIDKTGLSESLGLTGLTASHQSWIYAGVGAGILFILLTSIGVGIFYCCDPRSRADQTFQRIVSKDQVNRLRSCYGCQKMPGPGMKQNGEESRERSTDASGVRTNDTRSQNDEAESIELCSHNVSRKNSTGEQPHSKSLITTSTKADITTSTAVCTTHADLASLGGSLIRETVSTGENRLLVSCDGPEPTVLLATRLSTYNDPSSPSSVYGMFDASKLSPSIKVPLPGPVCSYICSPSFSGQSPPGIADKTHIYASLSPVTNLHGLNKTPQLISLPKPHYSAPCPVHGSIQLNRIDLSQAQTPTSGAELIQPDGAEHMSTGLVGSSRTDSTTSTVICTNTNVSSTTHRISSVQKPFTHTSNTGLDLSGNTKLAVLPERWYRSTSGRSQFSNNVTDDDEDEVDQEDEDNPDEEEEEEVVDEEDEEEDEDDDSGLLSHSTTIHPHLTKSDIPFRSAAQFIDPRRYKSRGGTTLHRPKSFTVLNSRVVGAKSRVLMPQSGSIHTIHPDSNRTGRSYAYPIGDSTLNSGGVESSPTCRRVASHSRTVTRNVPRRQSNTRPLPYKSCMRPSYSGDLNRDLARSAAHRPLGSNPDTSDETWHSNSNSDSGTPTEETSSLMQAVEVMSNTERSSHEEELAAFPRRSTIRYRGSSSTLNFPTAGWSNYPTLGGSQYGPSVPPATGVRSAGPAVYRVATLPSRFRRSHSPRSGSANVICPGQTMRTSIPSGSYRDFSTIQRRSSTQRSQTLIRPGSKHKLDTDSGTDNNDQ